MIRARSALRSQSLRLRIGPSPAARDQGDKRADGRTPSRPPQKPGRRTFLPRSTPRSCRRRQEGGCESDEGTLHQIGAYWPTLRPARVAQCLRFPDRGTQLQANHPTTVPKGGSGRGGEQPGHRRAPGRHDRASTATACLACPNGHNQADQRLLLVGAAQDAKQTVNVSVGGATTTMQEHDRQRIASTLASPPDSAVGKFKIALAAHHRIYLRTQSLVTASSSFTSICKSASSISLLLVFILMPPFLN